ncbi:MAG: 2-oxo acid dehydrogenase subunit E2 [Candidatus Cryptobacteroides sp.]|uniref:2-oxo acid dehydrogenase subunit E2 n=1 Tax=Candidatus Cryptobacteroides sp. TaxID=2952915 RepID=UPI002A834995|nr:2-oxo acid dehydrogenase subunit E2 [Candidatus Cryptobacteroides sp.]MDY5042759.1 2-oxo acid dehydrogenase subunit E2 [Candidatus Cryptobacteroides sp.]
MAQVVIMPKQGQSVESCIVSEFKKKVGDQVAVGDVLFSYETDKASFDEESKVAGTVLACFFADGDEIPVLTNVMVIGNPGESFAEFAPSGAAPVAETPAAPAPAAPAAAPAAPAAPAAIPHEGVVFMPKNGQSVESCIVSEFKVKVGDTVKVGDVLFSYETDKASFDEEAKVDGTVLAIFWNDGDEIPVLQNVMVIGKPGDSFAEFDPKASAAPAAAPAATATPAAAPAATPAATPAAAPAAVVVAGAPVSPRARKLAEEKGVNTAAIAGTGPHGRIIERDVIAAAAAQGPLTGLAKAKMAEGGLVAGPGTGLAGTVKGSDLKVWKANHTEIAGEGEEFEVKKMSNMRKIIAKSMYNSLQNSAQLTHMLGADARKVQAIRKKAKKALEEGKIDVNITINDLVCYAVIKALLKFPNVNSHCLGDAMRLFRNVNLGIAVDTERGLMVPAVKNANDLNIIGLSKNLKKVAEDCKKGSISPDLLSSEAASFTVSNLGGFGVEYFTPIINVPQSAILGVGTIVARPKDLGNGVYAFVPYMGLSLTYDHRAIDGGEATKFLKQVAVEIENLEVEF